MHLHLLLSKERMTASSFTTSSDQGNHHRSNHEWQQLRQPHPGVNIQRSKRRESKVIENQRTQHNGEERRPRTPGERYHNNGKKERDVKEREMGQPALSQKHS